MHFPMPRLILLSVLAGTVLLASSAGAQSPGARPVDVTSLGPQVGAKVPDFAAVDQHGRRQTLKSVMGPKGLMLVFTRSADW